MEFLYLLERIRVPALDELMLLITRFGEELPFMVIGMVLFWCVDKYKGYYVLSVGFLGTLLNQFMKLWFRVPRPWVLDPEFKALEKAVPAAGGYSFPSGHTQCAVGTFGGIAWTVKDRFVRITAICLAVLVPFSRMYLGVHTPLDVFTAAAIACLLLVILKPVLLGRSHRAKLLLMLGMTGAAIAYLLFVKLYQFPEGIDMNNLLSGTKNAYTLVGTMLGMLIVYILDEYWIRFPTKAVWWVQIIKVFVGICLVLAVKEGLRTPLTALFGEYPGRSVRYFLMVLVAGFVWPLFFKLFSKIGNRE